MTLCWSLDKLAQCAARRGYAAVLQAISGPDAGDVSSVPSVLNYDGRASVAGLKVGYFRRG